MRLNIKFIKTVLQILVLIQNLNLNLPENDDVDASFESLMGENVLVLLLRTVFSEQISEKGIFSAVKYNNF